MTFDLEGGRYYHFDIGKWFEIHKVTADKIILTDKNWYDATKQEIRLRDYEWIDRATGRYKQDYQRPGVSYLNTGQCTKVDYRDPKKKLF